MDDRETGAAMLTDDGAPSPAAHVPRRLRIVVRSNAYTMPSADDPLVRPDNCGLVVDLDGAWEEVARQGRRALLLVVPPRAGGTMALHRLGATAPGPRDHVRCTGPDDLDGCLAAVRRGRGTVLIDDAHRLDQHLSRLLDAVAASTAESAGPHVALVVRRATFTPDLASDALLELHLDPIDADATAAVLAATGAAVPGLSRELWRGHDEVDVAIRRRPPLLLAAISSWGETGSLASVRRTAAAMLAEERTVAGLTGAAREGDRGDPESVGATPLWRDVPAASARIGSPASEVGRWSDESPTIEVDVPAFQLAATAVTNEAFSGFLTEHDDVEPPLWWDDPRMNGPDQPVVGVSRDLARLFASWAGARLPTETEWERACRDGNHEPRYGPLDDIAWHGGNSGGHPHQVGMKRANGLGLHDLLGNAWEWVEDDFHPDHHDTPRDGSAYRGDAASGTLRGGSWSDNPRTVRAATRLRGHPGPRYANVGLRLARSR